MSQFSNPGPGAAGASESYIKALLDLAGDAEPVPRLASLLDEISHASDGLDSEQLRTPERQGKWSIIEVLQHLADTELVVGFRLRMILAHDTPPIHGFDQDLWAGRLQYVKAHAEETLAQLRVLREANVRLLSRLSPEDWQRAGMHSERGLETIERMFRLAVGHDLVHLRQIARIRTAIVSPEGR